MTNLERIRQMSAEELALKISESRASCLDCPIFGFCESDEQAETCRETIKKWLKSEAE